ncbi:lipopolysaccharide assembly protein LapA domain-containing protein [Aquabacter spiritensis]|uniref:Putative integral membrane protein n=1 Tax=Aquabacter spiritensis TaxID=933073 RepID=A0A4R3LKW9_9HYPH|nr:lipopolysaccharide assembly protein LapA domain-containing protein [Aquabacter spiritensis]TCT00551.1 putative integral membrane protein [Aquabacter spiritensis]
MLRILSLIIGIPLAILVVALAVANRRPVTLSFDPFNPDTTALAVSLPLFGVIFAALILGVVLGGAAAWLRQGRYRREARRARTVAPQPAPRGPALPAPVRRT